jgi:hypothetical protein
MLKHSPDEFKSAMALMVSIVKKARYFPKAASETMVTYIPKKGKEVLIGNLRPISVSSIPGKLLEKLTMNNLFPISPDPDRPSPDCAEQFGNLSADAAVLVLTEIIYERKARGENTYVVFLDVKEAFDRIGDHLQLAKMAKRGIPREQIEITQALLEHKEIRIRAASRMSEKITRSRGLGQGKPSSGKLFTLYISDIPDEIRKCEISITSRGVEITCIMFQDDIVVPLGDHKHVQILLDKMTKYGKKWDIIFAPQKFNVLAFGDNTKRSYQLGETEKPTERTEKYLSIILDTQGNWKSHFAERIKKAKSALGLLLGAGIMGGKQPAHKAVEIAKATLWSIVDSGRLATNYLSDDSKIRRKEVQKFKIKVAKIALNVSKTAPSIGVLAELGWIGDLGEAEIQLVRQFKALKNIPRQSLAHRYFQAMQEYKAASQFINMFDSIQKKYSTDITNEAKNQMTKETTLAIIKKIVRTSRSELAEKIQAHPILSTSFNKIDKPQKYLQLSYFRGRSLLTRIRLNDVPLNAAGYNTHEGKICEMCQSEKETIAHFLLDCKKLDHVRSNHASEVPGLKAHQSHLTTEIRLKLLLMTYSPKKEEYEKTAKKIGNYMADMWSERKKILKISFTRFI